MIGALPSLRQLPGPLFNLLAPSSMFKHLLIFLIKMFPGNSCLLS